jgi:DNA-3-methyladenine glycosylase
MSRSGFLCMPPNRYNGKYLRRLWSKRINPMTGSLCLNRMKVLKKNFYARDTRRVARELLGQKLVRRFRGNLLSGLICETEAYIGSADSASHAFKGQTTRNAAMFGPAGVAYVYFVYGLHYMLNLVTEKEKNPCAILIRAIVPLESVKQMERLRGRRGNDLTDGPAKLCQALAVDTSLNGWDVTVGKKLWLEAQSSIPERFVSKGPRIGIDYAKPADRKAFRRFWVEEKYIRNVILT